MLTLTTTDRTAAKAENAVFMRPVSFAGCFGWLHADPDHMAADTAVLICAGLKEDALTGHRSFRLLANALAAAGYPTLRFDYPGTGDSEDGQSAETWGLWRHSIRQAATFLRAHSGAQRIVLCGLRMGATMAALEAGTIGSVAGLILLEPVLRGRSYIRQIEIEASLQTTPSADGSLDVQGLHLPAATIVAIGQTDLRQQRLPSGCRVMVLSQAQSPMLDQCATAWRKAGAVVETLNFAGLEAFLRPTVMNHEAPAELGPIVDWLCRALPAGPATQRARRVPEPALLQLAECVETPLRFGPDGRLFGMLCRPRAAAAADADLAVVIGNAGGDPHAGFARAGVALARRLAAEGIASLRIDFAGLGDSQAEGDAATHVLEADRRSDIRAAIDTLEDFGYRRFAAQGLCAGAYHAFHAALADPRIATLLLINMPVFQVQAGRTFDFLNQARQSPVDVMRRLVRPQGWRKLRLLVQKRELDLRLRLAMQASWIAGKAVAAGRHLGLAPRLSFARESMRILAPRTRSLFLLSEGDVGITALAEEFGAALSAPGACVQVLPGVDHSLTGAAMRRQVADRMIAFLRQGAAQPAAAPSPRAARRWVTASV